MNREEYIEFMKLLSILKYDWYKYRLECNFNDSIEDKIELIKRFENECILLSIFNKESE